MYSQLEYCLDAISYQYCQLTGELPTYNLVSHSRGGLTVMQYALGHPYNVASLYTIGSSFDGSEMGRVKISGENVLLGLAGYSKNYKYADGKIDYAPGIIDLTENTTALDSYRNFWNAYYDDFYSHINFTPIGCYTTLGCALQVVAEAVTTMGLNLDLESDIGSTVNSAFRGIALILEGVTQLPSVVLGHFSDEISAMLDSFWESMKFLTKETEFGTVINALSLFDCRIATEYSHIGNYNKDFEFVILDDLFLHLDSQVAAGYNGRNVRVKCFDSFDQLFGEKNVDNVGVVHNLEIHDKEIVSFVVNSLNTGAKSDYNVFYTPDGCVITGYVGTPISGVVTIPSVYNGSKVIGIDCFNINPDMSGKTTNHANITKIIIPDTVKAIGDYAFAGMKNLREISFSGANNIEQIGKYAFAHCSSLISFNLGARTSNLADEAFLYSGIKSFTIDNTYYSWNGSLLINNNVTDLSNKIAIYANPTLSAITIPNDVKSLGAYLFAGNQTIKSLDFNQTNYIGPNAFVGSTVSVFKNTSNILDADISAFIGSQWLDNQTSNYITLGKVLLYYKGNDSQIVVPEGIVRIGENALSGEQIRSTVLPSTLTSIGRNTFSDCPNLDWVLLKSTNPPVLDGDCFDSDVTIYVKQTSLNYYLNNIYFKNLDNTISSKNVSVTFKDKDGKTLGTKTETYYSTFDKYVSAPAVTGYDFVCWLDPEGKEVYVNNIFTYYNNVILTAYYEPSKYTITLNNGNSNETVIIEYGETVDLDTPYKQGYNFLGWYDSPTGGNQIIDASGKCVWQRTNEVEALYARFSPITYTITYSTARGTFDGTAPTTFTVESPITTANIPEIKEFGYVFDYWKYGGKSFTTTYGIYSNITLTAKWLGTKTTVTSSTTRTINYEYSIVDMSSASYNGTYSYKIASNVKSVVFIGSTSKIFTDMKISVNSRNTALLMGFNNMKFYPKNGSGFDAIYSPYGCELYVSYKGTNRITGARGADGADGAAVTTAGAIGKNGSNGQSGGNGINAWKVNLAQFDDNSFITITGGRGGDGGDGSNGQAGANGTRPPNGSIFAPHKGENGYKGGNGGRGGNGGNGGYAIKVYANTYLKTDKEDTYKLIGGRGGNGGRGGKGGAGGAGANDSSANPFTGVGDPGNGGNGGNGGRGGNGGNGSLATNALYVYGTGGAGGTRGAGGKGGAAGAGGDSGTLGADGNDGLPGVIGKNGAYGVAGATGYNTIGTDESIVTIPYLYDKETMADLFS